MKPIAVPVLLALSAGPAAAFEAVQDDAAITIRHGGKTVLVYHKADVPPPEGADPKFRRSGFIHPLCSPAGEPVTGIHPDDHIHHVGLWGAWVNTKHGGRKPDFWNLKKGSGRVRFKDLKTLQATAEKASLTVLQEYVSYDGGGGDEAVVLREELSLDIRLADGAYLVDYRSTQSNVSDIALELPAYRYGGPIAYRGPAAWDKDNSTVLTSAGKTRADGHATRARWVAFAGPVEGGKAGLVILCHPENRDAPQRVRIWPPTSHNGAVFFNYVPIQEHAWEIAPAETVAFRYGLLVHDGATDRDTAEATWKRWSTE